MMMIIIVIIHCEMTVELFFSQSQNLEVFRKSTSYSCWKYYYTMAGIVADQKMGQCSSFLFHIQLNAGIFPLQAPFPGRIFQDFDSES